MRKLAGRRTAAHVHTRETEQHVDGDFAHSIGVRHYRAAKKHAVSWQNCGGVGNNELLLSSIRNSFPGRAALKSRWMGYNQGSF